MVGEELLNKKLVKKDIEKDFRDWIFFTANSHEAVSLG
jgi:hypothetical protein